MARRLGALTSRPAEDAEEVFERRAEESTTNVKPQPNLRLFFCLLLFVVVFITFYAFADQGFQYTLPDEWRQSRRAQLDAIEEQLSVHAEELDESFSDTLASNDGYISSRPECRVQICELLPILQAVYGKILHRTLHIGPGSCGVVSNLLKEDDVEVWGIQPFDLQEPIHPLCENFIRKGIIRVSDPYNPLPYRRKSFSVVIVTGILDHMKPKELNQTLFDLASLSSHSIMLAVGNGVQQKSSRRVDGIKTQKLLKPRSRMWWQRRLAMVGLEEDAEHSKRFEILQTELSFKTTSNIFHLHAPKSDEDVRDARTDALLSTT